MAWKFFHGQLLLEPQKESLETLSFLNRRLHLRANSSRPAGRTEFDGFFLFPSKNMDDREETTATSVITLRRCLSKRKSMLANFCFSPLRAVCSCFTPPRRRLPTPWHLDERRDGLRLAAVSFTFSSHSFDVFESLRRLGRSRAGKTVCCANISFVYLPKASIISPMHEASFPDSTLFSSLTTE